MTKWSACSWKRMGPGSLLRLSVLRGSEEWRCDLTSLATEKRLMIVVLGESILENLNLPCGLASVRVRCQEWSPFSSCHPGVLSSCRSCPIRQLDVCRCSVLLPQASEHSRYG